MMEENSPVRDEPGLLYGLWDKPEYVPYRITIICGNPTFSGKNFASFGYPVLDHLVAHGAGLAAGQVTVVTALQVNANLGYRSAT